MGHHNKWNSEPMRNIATVQTAARMSRALEDKAKDQHGLDLIGARAMISRETKVSANTLANLRRDPPRLGEVAAAWVTQRLAGFMIRTLEAEIARAEHDLAIYSRLAFRHDADEILAAEMEVEKLRNTVKRIAGK